MSTFRHVSLLASVAATGIVSTSALGAAPPDLPPAATQSGVTYEKDIRAIFQENCFRCHGAERAKGEIRLDSLEATLKGGEDGKIVLPGNSAGSSLVLAVARVDERSAMPPIRKPKPGGPPPSGGPGGGPGGPGKGGPPARALTAAEVGLIRAWIDQGAK